MQPNLIVKKSEMAQFIREARLLTCLTQERFAAAVGVTYPTVNRWENSRAYPSPMAVKLIEKMLLDLGEKGQTLLSKYSHNPLD
jgi:putative transcriptional regulator